MRHMKLAVVVAVVVGIAALIYAGRDKRREAVFYPMGGIPFKVVAYGRSSLEFKDDMRAVEKRVSELEKVFSRFDTSSELSNLNREASVAPVKVSQDMSSILKSSNRWYVLSNGAFDPSVTPLIELWKKAGKEDRLPADEQIRAVLPLVGLKQISYTNDGRVLFAKQGMSLDFGAIAKGWIADEVAKLLKSRGVSRGIVDAGGNALAFGKGSFTFGIADPRSSGHTELMGTVEVSDGGVVTSGNYERFVSIGGKRYSHIINPKTGWPVDNGLASATVIGGTGTDADALATSLMVLGRQAAIELIKQVPECRAILIEDLDGVWHVWASSSLIPRLHLNGMWADNVHIF